MLALTNQLLSQIGGTSRRGESVTRIGPYSHVLQLCSAGPIVEQGTHFCDLSRYFGGEVDISSVVAHALEWDENAGQLSKIAIDESKIAPENRIPRVTCATWYDSSNLRTHEVNRTLPASLTTQEIRFGRSGLLHPRRYSPGSQLQLRVGGPC